MHGCENGVRWTDEGEKNGSRKREGEKRGDERKWKGQKSQEKGRGHGRKEAKEDRENKEGMGEGYVLNKYNFTNEHLQLSQCLVILILVV